MPRSVDIALLALVVVQVLGLGVLDSSGSLATPATAATTSRPLRTAPATAPAVPLLPDARQLASAVAAAVDTVPDRGGDQPPGLRLRGPHVVVIGDSIMAWNRARNADVGSYLARYLGREVDNRSVAGAVVLPRSRRVSGIPGQRTPGGDHGWEVVEGGANDLGLHCGVPYSRHVLDLLVSDDGTSGRVVELVEGILEEGRHVVLVSYYQLPAGSRLTDCRVVLAGLEARLQLVADRLEGVVLVRPSQRVTTGDGLLDNDATHPTPTASNRIAALIADAILASEARIGPPPRARATDPAGTAPTSG